MNAIAPQRIPNEDWESIWSLWEGFLENYNAFQTGKMRREDEDKYRLLSSPGPSQYYAFTQFFSFFKKEEQLVKEKSDILYTYDAVDTEELTARPMLDFLQNLCSSAYDAKGKNIVMASGSFWEQNLKTRTKVISYFNELHRKGARVSISARAKENEAGMDEIIDPIRKESHFGLTERIPIHFIKADMDFIQPEFPHTESSLFRLTMFLDLNELETELKEGKTKKELADFFNGLINGVSL